MFQCQEIMILFSCFYILSENGFIKTVHSWADREPKTVPLQNCTTKFGTVNIGENETSQTETGASVKMVTSTVYLGDTVHIRCILNPRSCGHLHTDGRCRFYTNGSTEFFRTASYKPECNCCNVLVFVEEFVGDADFRGRAEVSLTCSASALPQITHKNPEANRIVVIDRLRNIPRPRIEVDPKWVKPAGSVNISCRADKGQSCAFYTNNIAAHFRKSPYSEELGGCRVSVLGVDLLGERDGEGGAEVQLRCAVEVEVGGEVLPSRLSHAVTLEISAHAEAEKILALAALGLGCANPQQRQPDRKDEDEDEIYANQDSIITTELRRAKEEEAKKAVPAVDGSVDTSVRF
ncbi:hypothetical protein JZ751_012074 [Albula glossodonta]|uniref:Uncharacterized protein n=1 Tax=Albula glossodonta TaxID=121402 RepID=A0A8T2PRG2_9TELE|nr:hypothetical protein JZ751_012074 [Albula glossodonta]